MIRLLLYAFVSAAICAGVGFSLAGSLAEGAIAGALVGGSIGIIIATRRAGGSGPAFEYEAAGIHDDNLITTARRNLVREANREFMVPRERDAQVKAEHDDGHHIWRAG